MSDVLGFQRAVPLGAALLFAAFSFAPLPRFFLTFPLAASLRCADFHKIGTDRPFSLPAPCLS